MRLWAHVAEGRAAAGGQVVVDAAEASDAVEEEGGAEVREVAGAPAPESVEVRVGGAGVRAWAFYGRLC